MSEITQVSEAARVGVVELEPDEGTCIRTALRACTRIHSIRRENSSATPRCIQIPIVGGAVGGYVLLSSGDRTALGTHPQSRTTRTAPE